MAAKVTRSRALIGTDDSDASSYSSSPYFSPIRFHGTALTGLVTDTAMVMTGDGMSHTEVQYDLAQDAYTVVRLDEFYQPVIKVCKINSSMFFCASGNEDDCKTLRIWLLRWFAKWGWEKKTFRQYADLLQDGIKKLEGSDEEKPQALLGGFDKNEDPCVPLLYMVSTEYVFAVHASRERFVCIGCGHDISGAFLTPRFDASTCSVDQVVWLGQGSVARAGDDGSADGIITTVAVTAAGIVHHSGIDIKDVRKLHGFRPVRRPLL
ncbi:hypothetical protein MKW98_005898 [Papaver atlanticum]|uniref:Uncharacterized protein n=1 Tax=Papaver atlanticum TaxID=357466 RepID=A0AAD4TAW4_9MAGN|nr:hypothetical protein MKW98_005898 [Papaver atlanticum]